MPPKFPFRPDGRLTNPGRRHTLALLGAGLVGLPAHAIDRAGALLRQGGCAVLLRHAQTEPGIGDPPGFVLGQCATQRKLSEAGRADAKRIGRWFAERGLVPSEVKSSAWCRCTDTADLAFRRHRVWPALYSTFGDRLPQPDQTGPLREALMALPAGRFEVWVTHQVNVTALTGEAPAMGEAFIVDRQGKIRFRTTFG